MERHVKILCEMSHSQKTAVVQQILFAGIVCILLNTCEGIRPFDLPEVIVDDADGRVRGIRSPLNESDFYMGGLIGVHISEDGGSRCSETFLGGGGEVVEAVLFSIDSINKDPDLLTNVTLGFDIRDSCISRTIGADETLDWIQCSDVSQTCTESSTEGSMLIGFVGPEPSYVSIPIASLFRIFQVPQVSYISTSPSLSNKILYPYFLRTVPPDTAQAEAMIDIVRKFEWTVISIVYSNDDYGEQGTKALIDLVSESGICIDTVIRLDVDDEEIKTFSFAEQLVFNTTAEVIVAFSGPVVMRKLFEQLQKVNSPRRFTWIASDAWARSESILANYEQTVVGIFGVHPQTATYTNFVDYFSTLTISNNRRNPWFEGYCQQLTMNNCDNDTSIPNVLEGYTQNLLTPFVVDAVYSIAHGLNNFLQENCEQPVVWNRTAQSCKGQTKELSGSTLLPYIRNVNFTSPTKDQVFLDENGDGNAVYEILNLQKLQTSEYENIVVGLWTRKEKLTFKVPVNELQFGMSDNGEIVSERDSECTSCMEGYAQVIVPTSCCSYCNPCLGNFFVNFSNPSECTPCPEDMWGNNPLNGSTSCIPLEESYLSAEEVVGIILLLLQFCGIVLLVVTSIALGIFWNNAVIKSFGREQLILIMTGLGLCYVFPVLYVLKASTAVCTLQQLGLWFSLTLIFASLLIKLIRVTRIFIQPNPTKVRFVSPWQQVLFTLIIVAGQMLLVVISLIVVHPGPKFEVQRSSEEPNDFPVILVVCEPPHAVLLVLHILYETVLIILINAFGIFTIRFPRNFNESKYIAFSTFAIGMVWIAFVPTYFSTRENKKFQAVMIALALMMMALCITLCLVIPRLYIAVRNKHIPFEQASENKSSESSAVATVLKLNRLNLKALRKGSISS